MNIDYEKLEDKLIFPNQCKSQLDKVGFFLESQRLYNKMEIKLMYKPYINFETESKNLRELYNINIDDLYDNFVKFRKMYENQ